MLHLLAIARAADVDLTIDDFQTVADKTPYLCDLKYVAFLGSTYRYNRHSISVGPQGST